MTIDDPVTPTEHRERHQLLHRMLDELIADYCRHNPGGPWLSRTIGELMEWSYTQTLHPTEEP